MNLWMFGDNVSTTGPTNGQPHELILSSFKYTPLPPDPVPGDFNADGEVDASDFQSWRDSFSSTVALAADGNNDGVVNAADFTVWRDNLASVQASQQAGQVRSLLVPEPSSFIALI
ncbi:MAG: dockerin type I repeat-containing protein [Pirellulales bacterium]